MSFCTAATAVGETSR